MRVLVFLVVVMVAVGAFGQLSPDEARAKLEQKQAERAAATSRPSTLTQWQVDQLLAQIETLRAQVVQLRADNESLRKKLAAKGAETKPARDEKMAGKAPDNSVLLPPPGRNNIIYIGMTEKEFYDVASSPNRRWPSSNWASVIEETKQQKTYKVQVEWGKAGKYAEHQWIGIVAISGGEVTAMRGDEY